MSKRKWKEINHLDCEKANFYWQISPVLSIFRKAFCALIQTKRTPETHLTLTILNPILKLLIKLALLLQSHFLWSQSSPFPDNKIMGNYGLCLAIEGEMETYMLREREFLSGEFALRQCGSRKVCGSFDQMERYSLEISDSCAAFESVSFFYNPETKEYDYFLGYRTQNICLTAKGEIQTSDEYYFTEQLLSAREIETFVKSLDSIFANDTLLLDKANGYGFADMLFYCAIAGNQKATNLFPNLLEILKERNLLSEYGGEPAQIYVHLRKIFQNL